MLKIKLIPAEYGDSILLSIGEKNKLNILVDGGLTKTYQNHLKPIIQGIQDNGEKIDLIVCTHTDTDHISGLIPVVYNASLGFIKNIWYNGLLQIVNSRFYSSADNRFTARDTAILDDIISKGIITDDEKEIGINEGMSLGVIVSERKIPLNIISEGKAICSDIANPRYAINSVTQITVVGPSINNIIEIENYWTNYMAAHNYMFRVSDKIKLMEAFEFQLERIKCLYKPESHKICENDDLAKYIGELTENDDSIINKSSISFILKHNEKIFLFLGDAVVDEYLLKSIEKVVGYKCRFSAIKLPHHGSRYNISQEFVDRYTADEYYCCTNSKKYSHPDVEVLASLLCKDTNHKKIVFNYPIDKASFIDKEKWKLKYNYEVVTGNGDAYIERIFE